MAHGDALKGEWRGNWRMEWVASTFHTTSEHGVFSITTADAHTSAASSRLNWPPPPPPADLNGFVRFVERRNLVSVRVPSHFKRSLTRSYMVEPDKSHMTIRHMRSVCWIPKATNTHSQYVIRIAFPRRWWMHERASILRCCTYVASLMCLVLEI
jgi:hypothetical protein